MDSSKLLNIKELLVIKLERSEHPSQIIFVITCVGIVRHIVVNEQVMDDTIAVVLVLRRIELVDYNYSNLQDSKRNQLQAILHQLSHRWSLIS